MKWSGRQFNGAERLKIASRAPVDVYIPTLDGTRFVSDYTGNYWPFRYVRYRKAVDEVEKVQRTVDRCESMRIDMGPGDPIAGPEEMYRLAEETGADEVVPRPIVSGRRQLGPVIDDYERYDFRRTPTLIVGFGASYKITAHVMQDELASRGNQHGPTDVGLIGFWRGNSKEDVIKQVRKVSKTLTGDSGIHLLDTLPTTELAAEIREYPNLVDSIAISPGAIEEETKTVEGLSPTGKRDLGGSIDEFVKMATEFSLLCSTYADEEREARSIPNWGKVETLSS